MKISSILDGAAPGLLPRRSGAATRSRKAPFATQGALNVGSWRGAAHYFVLDNLDIRL